MMTAIDSFVSKIAADRVNLVEPGHDQTFQIKLMRDGEIHVATERIDMCFERFGCSAAVLRLNRRRREFHEAFSIQKRSDRSDHSRNRRKTLLAWFLENGVKIPFAQNDLAVLQPGPLIGKRPKCLGDYGQRIHHYGNFAALRPHDFSGGFDNIAGVEEIEFRKTDISFLL